MPELPEVETIRRGIKPLITGKKVLRTVLRSSRLRWSASVSDLAALAGQEVVDVERRAKYLILHFSDDWLILHMGMTGSLRYRPSGCPPAKHDHFDLVFDDGFLLRFRDPRKFGGLLFSHESPFSTPLFAGLGPEPFSEQLDGHYLHGLARGRKIPVKNFIMDQKIIAGIGNIYANEALFLSGIRPSRAAGRIGPGRYEVLAGNIRRVLSHAIEAGGTSIRDFQNSDGRPGYFSVQLNVYGKEGCPCPRCGARIEAARTGQRSTFFCPHCQR